ncbi:MAG: hypothetical protein RL113_587 [Pseudomonadota bacterium]|jgi:hypothetical protein
MIETMLATHSILVKVFLGFLIIGVFAPMIAGKDPLKFKKASFVYTMIFQAIATMIAFVGIIAIFTGDLGWSATTIIMLGVWALLMYIEIKKHKLVKVSDLTKAETFQLIKGAFLKISIVQILLVVVMVVLMVLKAKGVIAL